MDKKLLEAFKKGEASPEELRKILQWLQSDEAELTFSEEIENYWKEAHDTGDNFFPDKEQVYNEILALIEQRSGTDTRNIAIRAPRHTKRNRNIFYNYRKLAAIFLLAILSGGLVMFLLTTAHPGRHKDNTAEFVEKFSPKGQKVTIQLPDGTLVKLNSRSKIKYPASFASDTRTVWLEGEGFFDVAKNKDKPFIIITNDVRTTVVGTSFNIRAFPEDNQCEIVVVTGKVRFDNRSTDGEGQGVFLTARQGAVFNKLSASIVKNDSVNLSNALAWKEGIIAFENANLDKIIRELENWYGVEFKVNSSAGIVNGYTGTYQNKSLESVLEGIGYVMNFRFEIKGKQVIIN